MTYYIEKNPRKSPLEGKSAKVWYISFIVIQFNNATAGGTVNLKVSQIRLTPIAIGIWGKYRNIRTIYA
jgi:hypothetical protein